LQTICGAAFLRGLSDRQTIRPTAAAKDDSDTKRRTDRCKAAPVFDFLFSPAAIRPAAILE
jgi:hypothetical protein